MSSVRSFIKDHPKTCLAAIILATSYTPFPPWGMIFGFALLWSDWWKNKDSLKTIFIQGSVVGFVISLFGFHWIAYTANAFGELNWFISILIMLVFCSFNLLHIPVGGVLWAIFAKRVSSPLAKAALLPVIAGIAVYFAPMIFPFHWAYPWIYITAPWYQFSSLIGFDGISFLTLLLNFGFFLALNFYTEKKMPISIGLVTLFALLNLSGFLYGKSFENGKKTLRVLQVQGNITNTAKRKAERGQRYRLDILNSYIKLSEKGLDVYRDVDLIVWPETAIHSNFLLPRILRQRVARFAAENDVHLITGAFSFIDKKAHNSLFHFTNTGNIAFPEYRKSILLAFGEYFPGSQTFPFLKDLVPVIGDYKPGPGPSVFDVNGVKIGLQICYEGLFADFSRELSEKGAQIILNATNDAWFGPIFEPYQHLTITLARGIENRLPVVRSTNTGITMATLTDGTQIPKLPVDKAAFGLFEVKYHEKPKRTFYSLYGHLYIWFLFGLLSIVGIIDRIKRS